MEEECHFEANKELEKSIVDGVRLPDIHTLLKVGVDKTNKQLKEARESSVQMPAGSPSPVSNRKEKQKSLIVVEEDANAEIVLGEIPSFSDVVKHAFDQTKYALERSLDHAARQINSVFTEKEMEIVLLRQQMDSFKAELKQKEAQAIVKEAKFRDEFEQFKKKQEERDRKNAAENSELKQIIQNIRVKMFELNDKVDQLSKKQRTE